MANELMLASWFTEFSWVIHGPMIVALIVLIIFYWQYRKRQL